MNAIYPYLPLHPFRVFWIFSVVKLHFVFSISLHPYFFRVFCVFRGSYRIFEFKSIEAKSIKQR